MKQKKVVKSDLKCWSGIFLEWQSETVNSSLGSPPSRDLRLESYEHRPVATRNDIHRIYLFVYLFIHLSSVCYKYSTWKIQTKHKDRKEIKIHQHFYKNYIKFSQQTYTSAINLGTVRPLYRTGVSLPSRESFLHIFHQQIHFIVWYLLDRASLIQII